MACTIPNFNFAFKVTYDFSTTTPSVLIENQSTGSNLANIDYWFELITPSGTMYHQGTQGSPDKQGVWVNFSVPEQVPQAFGHVEFSNSQPYIVKAYAKDNLNNTCSLEVQDFICAPSGNNGESNWGLIKLKLTQNCEKGVLQVEDITNYIYSGITGTLNGNDTIFVYPVDADGNQAASANVVDKNAFYLPIPVNGKNHQLVRNATWTYEMPSGNDVIIKYKYKKTDIEVTCGIDMCAIMCGLKKYRAKLSTDPCGADSQSKINALALKVVELSLAINSPGCGYDIDSAKSEIEKELLQNDCICEPCGPTGNNPSFALKCAELDLVCIWDGISQILNQDETQRNKFCALVTACLASDSTCSQVYIGSTVFSPTTITINFILSNAANSNNLEVFYKEHTSGVWISDGQIPSNSTTHDISGTFTPNVVYDVKIVNNCANNATTESQIISGIIPDTQNACYYLDIIFGNQTTGVWAIAVDTGEAGCNKYTYQEINADYVESLLPCPPAINFKISSTGWLTWTGIAGDYEISYKLKTDPGWTVYSTNTYAGTNHSEDLSAVLTDPIPDYEFRIITKCTSSDSLPVYTEYVLTSGVQCISPGGFVSFNEGTGELIWSGNGDSAAVFQSTAYLGGSPYTPSTITVSPNGLTITLDYSPIVPLMNPGDQIIFFVNTDCGASVVSDPVTYAYEVSQPAATCSAFNPGFSHTTIQNDVIIVNSGGGTTPAGDIVWTQYEVRVNGVHAGTGMLKVEAAETRIKSNINIKTGDTVEFRYRSFNLDAYTAWNAWFGTTVTVLDEWNDEWVAIPGGWYLNGAVAGASGAFYKITKDGKLKLRGSVDLASSTPTAYGYPAGTTAVSIDFLDAAAIYATLNTDTQSAGNLDAWSLTVAGVVSATVNAYGRFITRNGSVFTAAFTIINSGAPLANGIIIPLGGISIE